MLLVAACAACSPGTGGGDAAGGGGAAQGGAAPATRVVVDSRGVEVEIPAQPARVATVSDGLVEEVMIVFGVADRLVGIGSTCLVREFGYEYETASGETFSVDAGS